MPWFPKEHLKDPEVGPLLEKSVGFRCAHLDSKLAAMRESDDIEAVRAIATLTIETMRDEMAALHITLHKVSIIAIHRGPKASVARPEPLMPSRVSEVTKRIEELNKAKETLVQLGLVQWVKPD